MKETALDVHLEGWAVFVHVKKGMQVIPGRGMISREGRHGHDLLHHLYVHLGPESRLYESWSRKGGIVEFWDQIQNVE